MKLPDQLKRLLAVPKVTYPRIGLALGVAVVADTLELFSGPIGLAGFDDVVDVIAMILISRLIGFHILMLPSFVLEAVPVLDDLPTWIACVLAVSVIRRREQKAQIEDDESERRGPPLPKQ